MAGETNEHIPYLSVAEACMAADDTIDPFLLSLFDDVTAAQRYKFWQYVLGKFHDGIEVGLGISGSDPIGEIEAYKLGVTEGERRARERREDGN